MLSNITFSRLKFGKTLLGFSNETRLEKALFLSILISFLVISISYSIYTPAYETADSQFHYNYARLILESKIDDFSKQHNPLYYLILAGFLNFIDHPDSASDVLRQKDVSKTDAEYPYSGSATSIHILRIFSIICGLTTLVFTFKISKIVFPNDRVLQLFPISIIAFLPQFVFGSAALNNDILLWPLSTVSIYYLFKFSNNHESKYIGLSAVFAGLAYLTKSNGIILIGAILIVLLYLLFTNHIHKRNFLKFSAISAVLAIISGYWYFFYKAIRGTDEFSFLRHLLNPDTANASQINGNIASVGLTNITNWSDIYFRFIDRLWTVVWGDIASNIVLRSIGDFFLIIGIGGIFLIFIKRNTEIKIKHSHALILFVSILLMILLSGSFMFFKGEGVVRNTFPVISSFGILFSAGLYVFINKKKLLPFIFVPIAFLIIMNVQLLSVEHDLFWSSERFSSEEPFKSVLLIYNTRPDLQRAFPEVLNDDYVRLMNWADKYGSKGQEKLADVEPLIDLVNVYYSRSELRSSFPEVNSEHNITNLLKWTIEEGVREIPALEEHEEYYVKYYDKIK